MCFLDFFISFFVFFVSKNRESVNFLGFYFFYFVKYNIMGENKAKIELKELHDSIKEHPFWINFDEKYLDNLLSLYSKERVQQV